MRDTVLLGFVAAGVLVLLPLLADFILTRDSVQRGPFDCRDGYNIRGCWERVR